MSWLCVSKKKPPPPAALEICDCSHLNLVELPREVLDHRTGIRSLNLNSNAIKDIPKAIYQMRKLEDLDISENEAIFLSPSISQLPVLTTLNLSKNSLSSIPDAIKECSSLLTLNLSNNPLGELCDGVTELRLLRKLILTDIQMEELPPNIGKLEKLEVLDLRENMLQTLPSSLCHLKLLERLDLGTNEFVHIPQVIGCLESLSELWLDMNIISVLPEEIGLLRNLRFLELSENHLMMLPESMGEWTNLTHLYLSDNLLTLVPSAIEYLNKLSVLRLDHNRLGGLPDTLDGLYNVSEFSLSHNHITELPASIGGMTSMVDLNADDNLLSRLPPEIGQCTSLTILSVCNNHLIELPPTVSALSCLSILNLVGNQLLCLPYGLIKLANISAIWISGNQNRPIIELQLTRDEKGEKCLTCYLLPQQGHEAPFVEGSSPLDSVEGEEEPVVNKRASQVNFDLRVPDKPKATSINRDPTPFPKELHAKAMQWRAARQAAVGGAGAQGEEGVTKRMQSSAKQFANRNSLLTALANPVDDHLFAADQGPKPLGRRGRQVQSNSREGTPHPPTIPEGAELPANKATYKHGAPVSPTRKTDQTSNSIAQLPPPFSPESSASHSTQSGPYLDPPTEFAPGQNGNGNVPSGTGIRHDAVQEVNSYENLPQQVFMPNGNNNNNNNNSISGNSGNSDWGSIMKVTYSTVRTADHVERKDLEPTFISHHLQSSAESGFVADNESSQPWYASPHCSPQSHRRSQGGAATSAVGQTQDSREYAQLSNNFAALSLRQERQHSGYDHLAQKVRPGQSAGNITLSADEVGVGRGTTSSYHSASRSFDTAETLDSRVTREGFLVCPSAESRAVQSLPHHGKPSVYHKLNRGPSSMAGRLMTESSKDPLPIQQRGYPLPNERLQPSLHCPTVPQWNTRASQTTPSQLYSRPEATLSTSPMTPPPDPTPLQLLSACKPNPSGHVSNSAHKHTNYWQQRASQQGRSKSQSTAMAKHILSNDSIFQNSSGNQDVGVNDIQDGHGRFLRSPQTQTPSQWANVSPGSLSTCGCHRQQLSLDESHLYVNLKEAAWLLNGKEGSEVSERTISSTEKKTHSSSGLDSGFEGTKKDLPYYVKVVLKKAPSLGLGITGGKDGVNVINPGDKGFYVHKLLEGLPAHQSGQIRVGDQLVEVNGMPVSTLTTPELVALLTGPEKTLTLLLCRKPSLTLL